MVMERRERRVLTVEEARNPPPTEEEIARHQAAVDAIHENAMAILARRGGVSIPWEEIEAALDDDDDEDLAAPK